MLGGSIMANAIPIEIFELLEQKIGREEAKEIIKIMESSFETIEKKAEAVALQKKLEIKDELTKELATKADIALLKAELDRKFTVMFIILFFTIVFLNQNALEFLAKVLGLTR
jgi:hypothetical protein